MANTYVNGCQSAHIVRVCLASLSHFPLYSGAAVRFQHYAPGLAQRGIDMSVFTQVVDSEAVASDGLLTEGGLSHALEALDSPLTPGLERIDGVRVYRVQLPGGRQRKPAFFQRLVEHCRQHADEIDVVQLLSVSQSAASAVQEIRRLGIRTVLTQTMVSDLSRNPVERFLQRRNRRARYELVDWVVVSSGVMRQSIEDLGVLRPVKVIPNGVDLERFRPADSPEHRSKIRRALAFEPSWQVIVSVGPIGPRKGTDLLVEAFVRIASEHPNTRLVLVGPRYDLERAELQGFHARLEQLIDSGSLRDRVIFTGPVSNVPDYLKAADLFIFPSRREGFGNVVCEAMASAVPVIMTPFIGLPAEFGAPGKHYLLSANRAEALAQAVCRCLSGPALAAQLGQAARRWAETTFDINNSIEQYARLYRSLARQRLPAGAREGR